MTSNINYLGINENFPVAGEDNDTQVFRDNFDTIKTSLNTAKTEITDLQANVARTDTDNDFNKKLLSGAVMLNNYDAKFDGGVIAAPLTVDYENGNYQIFRFGVSTTIEFLNFPDDDTLPESVGKVTLELYSDGVGTKTITFSTTGGTVIKSHDGFPKSITGDPAIELLSPEIGAGGGNPTIIEVWKHKSDRLFLNYIADYNNNLKEDVSNLANINLKKSISYFSTAPVISPATTETATLAAGYDGQIKTLAMYGKDTTNMVITVTNAGWKSSGSGTITFDAIGDACTMQYINSKWFCIGNNGVVFA